MEGHLGCEDVPTIMKVRRLERCDYSWVWWCMPITLELDSLRQEDCCEFKANLCYIIGLKSQCENLFQKVETTIKPAAREAETMLAEGGMGKGQRQRNRETEKKTWKWFLEVANSKSFKGLQLNWPSEDLTTQLFANVLVVLSHWVYGDLLVAIRDEHKVWYLKQSAAVIKHRNGSRIEQ